MGIALRTGHAPVRIFASAGAWIEGAATQQLDTVATREGVIAVAGMPDLHPGKYGPVGSAMLATHVDPAFVGSDIGCGMGLYGLDLPVRKLRLDKAAERLRSLEGSWDGDSVARIGGDMPDAIPFARALGTIGGGNHFCEVQAINEILDPERAAAVGLDRERAFVLVHSGSRGLGNAVFDAAGVPALDPGSDAGLTYRRAHDEAVAFAKLNRSVVAERAAEALKADARLIADLPHNFVEPHPDGFLHRKGAAPADRGLVPIPGSRATLSYLVAPLPASPEALASLAHGAGRKFDRGSMRHRAGRKKSDLARLSRNPYGGYVICEDRTLLLEESPDAYKSIDRVIADLVAFGLATVVATFRPLVTFKTAREPRA